MIPKHQRISIVTPSLNQARFIEATIKSVLIQDYPDLEYVVIDGGSTDGSVDIIREYSDRLTYWSSTPDGGQYAAINEGFSRTSGEIMAWLNSDDLFLPWTLDIVSEIFAAFPLVEWITSSFPLYWDAQGRAVDCRGRRLYSRDAFMKGENLPGANWFATGHIQQESTFWRRSLWEKAGGHIDTSFELAGDFDLWARFFKHAELVGVEAPLGGFRRHGDQKTAHQMVHYLEEAKVSLAAHGGKPRGALASFLRARALRFVPRFIGRPLGLFGSYSNCTNRSRDRGWEIISSEHPDFWQT